MVLSQNSHKFHKFKQITKQGKINAQRRINGKKRLWYSDFPEHICIFFTDYKYPIFCQQILQTLHEHKLGFL